MSDDALTHDGHIPGDIAAYVLTSKIEEKIYDRDYDNAYFYFCRLFK